MVVKRRNFLQMLGGAVTAPFMPSASLAAVRKAGYPASALHAAIYHAQSQLNFSVFSLAQRLGLQLGQAEELMSDMSARGILGPMQGTTQAGRWARSKVWQRPFAQAAVARKAAQTDHASSRSDRQATASGENQAQHWSEPDIRPLLRNLYARFEQQGLSLHPRCAQLIA